MALSRAPVGMTPQKRLCDIVLVVVAGCLLVIPFVALIVVLRVVQGRPVFHVALRMRAPGQPFRLWKLRTMTVGAQDGGVSGGDKAVRITRLGHVLRRTRLDEIPQLWNILRGDMSFVGPRPPLPVYVDRFPELYARVLQSRPGITGLATLHYHAREERLLAGCRSAIETDLLYARVCVPQKARLDLFYQKRASVRRDIGLLAATLACVAGHRRLRPKQS